MPKCLITGCILHNKDTKESWRGDLHEVDGVCFVNANEKSLTIGDVNDEEKVVWFTSRCDMFERRGVFIFSNDNIDEWGLNEAATRYIS